MTMRTHRRCTFYIYFHFLHDKAVLGWLTEAEAAHGSIAFARETHLIAYPAVLKTFTRAQERK